MVDEEQAPDENRPVIPGLVPYAVAQHFAPDEFERLYNIHPTRFKLIAAEWGKFTKVRLKSTMTVEDRLILALLMRQGYGWPTLEKAGVTQNLSIIRVMAIKIQERFPPELQLPDYQPLRFSLKPDIQAASVPKSWGKAKTPRCSLLAKIQNSGRSPVTDLSILKKAERIIANALNKELALSGEVFLPHIGRVYITRSNCYIRYRFRPLCDLSATVIKSRDFSPKEISDAVARGKAFDGDGFILDYHWKAYQRLKSEGSKKADMLVHHSKSSGRQRKRASDAAPE